MKTYIRNRVLYCVLIFLVISLGLCTRKFPDIFPYWVSQYLGDALWALMVFCIMGFIFNKKSTMWVAAAALIFSFTIELSQLYHAHWIDSLRHTKMGGLVLGYGFLWSDLVCYTVGVLIGVFYEMLFFIILSRYTTKANFCKKRAGS